LPDNNVSGHFRPTVKRPHQQSAVGRKERKNTPEKRTELKTMRTFRVPTHKKA
jgi:hypothetical protein